MTEYIEGESRDLNPGLSDSKVRLFGNNISLFFLCSELFINHEYTIFFFEFFYTFSIGLSFLLGEEMTGGNSSGWRKEQLKPHIWYLAVRVCFTSSKPMSALSAKDCKNT